MFFNSFRIPSRPSCLLGFVAARTLPLLGLGRRFRSCSFSGGPCRYSDSSTFSVSVPLGPCRFLGLSCLSDPATFLNLAVTRVRPPLPILQLFRRPLLLLGSSRLLGFVAAWVLPFSRVQLPLPILQLFWRPLPLLGLSRLSDPATFLDLAVFSGPAAARVRTAFPERGVSRSGRRPPPGAKCVAKIRIPLQ